MEFNEAQKKAIYTDDKNILISASAGAGKTTVLIERLMHLIKDKHYEIDEILAMTFSEAAAAEMKKRLSKSLNKELKVTDDPAFINKQLANLNNANISTIHGFCLNIINEYYYVLDIDRERIKNPIDDSLAYLYRNKAIKNSIDLNINEEGFNDLLSLFNNRIEGMGKLYEAIEDLASLANSKTNPKEFLEECSKTYHFIQDLNELDSNVYHYFYEYFIVQTNLMIDLCKDLIIYENNDVNDQKLNYLNDALKDLTNNEYDLFRNNMLASIKNVLKATGDNPYKDDFVKLETNMLKLLFPGEFYIKGYNANINNINLLIKITSDYLDEYEKIKIEEKGIDFDDMEHYAISLLKANDGYVASIYRNKFKTIMVDEFQDSNDVQDNLVNLIAKDNNVFRVGDIKQSIYGFRHALPSIMKNLIKNKTEKDEIVYLSNNYRSSKVIVDFNNYIYDKLMNLDGLDSSYDEHDNVETGLKQQEEIKVPVTLKLIDEKILNEDKSKPNDYYKEHYFVYLVNELIKKGYKYSDIVILTRGNEKMSRLKLVFDEYNIPCFYNKKQGLYTSASVASVLSYLKSLIDPKDNISFISMLTSGIYRYTYEEIALKKISMNDKDYYNAYINDERLVSFYDLANRIKGMKISEVINEIYNINDFYLDYVDEQERANLDLLYEKCSELETKQDLSVSSLVSRLIDAKEADQGEAMPIGINDNVVKIMTMHASKGLQFKVVLIFSSNRFSDSDNSEMLNLDEQLKISLKYQDKYVRYPSITSIAFKQKKLKAYLEEEMRLFYVATTRAQNELYIIDTYDNYEEKRYSINEFYKLKGYTGWVRKAMKDNVSDLYKMDIISEEFEIENAEISEKESKHYYFNNVYKTSEFYSPSDSEIKVRQPLSFNINSKSGFIRGTTLHKMVELLPNNEWDKSMIEDVCVKNGLKLEEKDYDVLLDLNSNEIFKETLNYQNVYHEYPFITSIENKLMNGYMDYVAVNDNDVIMIDFKSDRGINKEKLIERYQDQIIAYHHALNNLYEGYKIKTYIYSFENRELYEIIPK